MKWILLLAIIASVPVFIGLLRSNPRAIVWAGLLVGFLPFGISPYHLYTAPISWAGWPGPILGIEVSFLDSLALAIVMVSGSVRVARPVLISFAIFLVAVLFSTAIAQQREPAVFYVWQLLRAVLVCVAVTRATARNAAFPSFVLIGLGAGLAIQASLVAMHFGEERAGGVFGANTLGIMSDFVAFPAMAMLLGGFRTRLALAILACDFIIVIGGGSRATIGLFGVGTIITIILSCWHRITPRKVAIASTAAIALALATPVLLWSIGRRTEASRQSSNKERDSFKVAARMMIDDHPLGIGANQYVVIANLGGYSARAGVPWNYSERSAPVHNTYYLVAVEIGIFGFLALASFLSATLLVGLRAIKHAAQDARASLLVGAVSALTVASIHIGFEWVAMLFSIHYLFAIAIGLVLGLRLDYLGRRRAYANKTSTATAIINHAQLA